MQWEEVEKRRKVVMEGAVGNDGILNQLPYLFSL